MSKLFGRKNTKKGSYIKYSIIAQCRYKGKLMNDIGFFKIFNKNIYFHGNKDTA
jgi:hypothetical protein